jgi:putative Mg2+ transporter-C (MgtC) family protein
MAHALGTATLPTVEVAARIALAFVLGALCGVERQWHHKNAGLRTHTLVAVGAAAFTIVSSLGLGPTNNPMLIAAGVVTGIGFIGGGVIMHQGPTVQGINTAATLWTTASLGLAAGAGYYALTVMVFLAVLVVQFPLQWVEHWIDRQAG